MPSRALRLQTDYLDYYDHWFDLDGEVFRRVSSDGMNRREMLEYLSSLGLRTPPFGAVRELWEREDDFRRQFWDVIVYLNERAHRGEGKVKLPMAEAVQRYPEHFASLYIPSTPQRAISWRYLQIGDKIFWLEYASADWRSNYGEVEIKVLSRERDGYHPKIHFPLFAIDFILADHLYAVDFNIAPQIRGTGVEELLPAREAAESIKKAFWLFNRRGVAAGRENRHERGAICRSGFLDNGAGR